MLCTGTSPPFRPHPKTLTRPITQRLSIQLHPNHTLPTNDILRLSSTMTSPLLSASISALPSFPAPFLLFCLPRPNHLYSTSAALPYGHMQSLEGENPELQGK